MKYRDFSAYWVIDEIKNGKIVYVLDKKRKTVEVVNEMAVNDAIAVINCAEIEPKRYEFWVEEEETENA